MTTAKSKVSRLAGPQPVVVVGVVMQCRTEPGVVALVHPRCRIVTS